jgi:hypothetical protein
MHQQLQGAEQYYGGHRQRAMQHIGDALGHLGSSVPASIPTVGGQANMPKPASGVMLKESRTSLENITKQLAAGGLPNGNAREALDQAIRELDLALSPPRGKDNCPRFFSDPREVPAAGHALLWPFSFGP